MEECLTIETNNHWKFFSVFMGLFRLSNFLKVFSKIFFIEEEGNEQIKRIPVY